MHTGSMEGLLVSGVSRAGLLVREVPAAAETLTVGIGHRYCTLGQNAMRAADYG